MHQKESNRFKITYFFSDAEFEMLSNILSVLLPIKLTVEAICRQGATLLSADAAIQFMTKSITGHPCSLSYELKATLKVRILERRTEISSVLQYLIIKFSSSLGFPMKSER